MENTAHYFAPNYQTARERFLNACVQANASINSLAHPLRGVDGEELAMDVAYIGPDKPQQIVMVTSGTHGVEGYAGSAVQLAWLEQCATQYRASTTGVLLIHAVNPHGFSFCSRCNEDNIDLNRHFVTPDANYNPTAGTDFCATLLTNEWSEAIHKQTHARLADYQKQYGTQAYQLGQGQQHNPRGLFFAGTAPSWSQQQLWQVVAQYGALCANIIWLDIHTGLGPKGVGTLIYVGNPFHTTKPRIEHYFGAVEDPASSDVVGAPLQGLIQYGTSHHFAELKLHNLTIEYGTLPFADVISALVADNWLRFHGDYQSQAGRQLMQQIKAALIVPETAWYDGVIEQGLAAINKVAAQPS